MRTILYTVAKNSSGELVSAVSSEKGETYFCPVCGFEMLLRRSGRTGKGSRRPHFAHRSLTPNCTPETALHYLFKSNLAAVLRERLARLEPFDFSWQCEHCGKRHNGNLLRTATSIETEHDLRTCRPDIALLDEKGKVTVAIEVVVTHKPTAEAIRYYELNRIALVQIDLGSESDLEDAERVAMAPTKVSVCRNPPCEHCGRPAREAQMVIFKGACWACGERMSVAVIELQGVPYKRLLHPAKFSQADIDVAAKHGADIHAFHQRTYKNKIVACRCPRCEKWMTRDQLMNCWYSRMDKDQPTLPIYLGYRCDHGAFDHEQ